MVIVAILCIVGLPLGLAIIIGSQRGFGIWPTLLAAVGGEVAGFLLFGLYNRWKVAAVLSHREPGAVAYIGPVDLSTRVENTLLFIGLAVAIGLLVVFVNWAYSSLRSA